MRANVHTEVATTSGGAGRTERILRGPLAWEIARFGAPLALGMGLQTTFNLVDAYILGQLPQDEVGPALGALGICDQIAALGIIASYGISTAAGAVVAQRQGANDARGVQRATWQSTLLVAVLGAIFGVLGLAFAGPIMRGLIGAKGEVAVMGTSYLRVSVTGSFTMFFLLQLTAIQRALGSAKTPASLLVLGNVVNVLLALLFVFGPGPAPGPFGALTGLARWLHVPRMGMLGAAWATVLARLVVLFPIAWIGVRRFRVGLPPPGEARPDLGEMRRVVRIAWPTSAQFVLRIGAALLINSLVARYFTTATDQTATTAIGLVFRLDTMAIFVAMGWGSAAQTFVGQNLGAKLLARAKTSGWITAGYDALTNVLLVVLVFVAGEHLLRLFDDDDAPVSIAMLYLVNVAPSYLGLGLGVVLGNAMAGAGATRTTLAVDAFVLLGVQVPLCVLSVAAFHWGLAGLFRCVAAAGWASAIVYAIVYVRVPWLSRTPEPSAPHTG